MMDEQPKRRGRPPIHPEAKRANFGTRMTVALERKLKEAAEANGRSLSEEIEHRLEQSFVHDALGDLEARIKRLSADLRGLNDRH